MKKIVFIVCLVCGLLSSCDLFFVDVSSFLDSSHLEKEDIQDDGFEYTLSSDGSYYSIGGQKWLTGVVVIPASHNDGKPIKEIDDGGFTSIRNITEVVLPNTIEVIGAGAFNGCPELEKVSIGSDVKTIETQAFGNSGKIEYIIVPETLSSLGKEAFMNCDGSCSTLTIYYEGMSSPSFLNDYTVQEKNTWHKVSFDSQGGSIVSPIPVLKVSNTISIIPEPRRDGFVFCGWYSDKDYRLRFIENDTFVEEDIVLYAKWD